MYANTAALIDDVIVQHHQVPADKTAASAYTRMRVRVLRNTQKALGRLWHLRDWTFTYVENGVVTLAAVGDDTGDLPAEWADEGQQGGAWLDTENQPLTWKRSGTIASMKQTSDGGSGVPQYYTVIGMRKLAVWPPTDTDGRVVNVRYRSRPPLLVDSTDGQGDPAPSNLELFPWDWRELLYEMVVLREMLAKGDVASIPAQERLVENGIFAMVTTERQGKPGLQSLPRYEGSADVFGGD